MTDESAVPVAIALGSNVGDRAARIAEALRRLPEAGVAVERASGLYETEPVGWPRDGVRPTWFLNAVCVGRTTLGPHALLAALQRLEEALGRTRGPGLRPRPLDLDLILYGDRIVRHRDLHVPHPRFRERPFVLIPLREVAPEWTDPVTGRSAAELADALGPPGASLRLHGPAPALGG